MQYIIVDSVIFDSSFHKKLFVVANAHQLENPPSGREALRKQFLVRTLDMKASFNLKMGGFT